MPWAGKKQLSMQSILSDSTAPFLGPSGGNQSHILFNNETNNTALGNKTIGVYFGAAWSQPCETFLPLLLSANKALDNSSSSEVQFVFVSLDQNESEFEQYRKQIPFPALPFHDRRRALMQIGVNIKSIPSLGNNKY
jgi:thiol-disulfide isomerase/thioredoxin